MKNNEKWPFPTMSELESMTIGDCHRWIDLVVSMIYTNKYIKAEMLYLYSLLRCFNGKINRKFKEEYEVEIKQHY